MCPKLFSVFFYGYVCSPLWQSLHVPILYLQNTCFCNSFWLVATFTSCIQLETDIHLITTEIWLALQRVERREGESNPWLAKMKWYVCSNVHYVIKVCQWLIAGQWFSPDPPVSSTNKIDRHDITEILLKVALNTITNTFLYISMHKTKLVNDYNVLLHVHVLYIHTCIGDPVIKRKGLGSH
jgi:hypothetical protein